MKKSLIALAVLAASGAAMAQSSVTLYGKVDNWFGVVDQNQGRPSQTVVESGGVGGSRWGMRGSEDLGGGLKANFTLESGFNADKGSSAQGGLLFGRQAWVGLSGGFGDIQIGRVRSTAHLIAGDYQGLLDSSALAPLNIIGRVNDNGNGFGAQAATLRFNNAISYTTPKMSGFSARVQYALGENNAAGTDADAAYAFNVNYAAGPLAVGAFYQVESCETAGAKGNATPACAGGNQDRKYAFLGAKYNFGVAVLKGSYGRSDDINGLNNAKSNEYQIGVDVPMSSALVLTASYARADDNGTQSVAAALGGVGKVDRQGYAVAAQYLLSKRTFMYAGVSYNEQTQSGIADNAFTAYALGMQHNF